MANPHSAFSVAPPYAGTEHVTLSPHPASRRPKPGQTNAEEEAQPKGGSVPRRGAARQGRGRRARETEAMEWGGQAAEGAMSDRRRVELRRSRKGRSEGLRLWRVMRGGEVARVALSSTRWRRRAAVGTRKSRGAGRATHPGDFGRGAPVDQVQVRWRRRRAADIRGPQAAAAPHRCFGSVEMEFRRFCSCGHRGPSGPARPIGPIHSTGQLLD
jgi:hypothetical protein